MRRGAGLVAEDDAQALGLALRAAGLITIKGGEARATADLRPYGFPTGHGQWDGWVVSDHTPGLDQDRSPTRPDYVLGVSPASTTLAQLTIDDPVGSALDLGTGCGVQSLHLSTHAGHLTATDVNPRCLDLARLTAALNRIDVDFRAGSLYEPVADESFDLIVTNPPFHIGAAKDSRPTLAMIRAAASVLRPGGEMWMVFNSHLPYLPELRRHIGVTTVEAQDRHYIVARALKEHAS